MVTQPRRLTGLKTPRPLLLATLLAIAAPAWTTGARGEVTLPSVEVLATPLPALPELPQAIYKGVVGNLLEAVPLDPQDRVVLQRGNAVVSNALSGRTLGTLLGVVNPALIIGGLIWGLWSATQIKPSSVALVRLAGHDEFHGRLGLALMMLPQPGSDPMSLAAPAVVEQPAADVERLASAQ